MPAEWEKILTTQIALLGAEPMFTNIYARWKSAQADLPSAEARYRWLSCLLHYARIDTDGDGVPDWTPVTDGLPSETLMPFDPDMDGDGVPNAMDADPLDPAIPRMQAPGAGQARNARAIPRHLVEREFAELQRRLHRNYGLLAISHTDRHSKAVLRELERVLRLGGLGRLLRRLGNVRFVYAFRGHSARGDIAAYHRGLDALSIGGIAAYGNRALDPASRVLLDESLVHEIGHAFLLKALSPGQLRQLATAFGGWGAEASPPDDFYAPVFFALHPASSGLSRKPAAAAWDIPSSYALTNMHEWFAECFASFVLARIERAGGLPSRWRDRLNDDPSTRGEWSDYGHLSKGFTAWFESNITHAHVEKARNFNRSPGTASLGRASSLGRTTK